MFPYRRVVDLIPNPTDRSLVKEHYLLDFDCQALVSELEQSSFTGCMKTVNVGRKSRSLSLLYKGSVVACAFTTALDPIPGDIDESLWLLVSELKSASGTVASLYPLERSLVLPLSALFMGSPVSLSQNTTNSEGYAQAQAYFQTTKMSGAICMVGSNLAVCIECIYKGEHSATIFVQEQLVLEGKAELCELAARRSDMLLESCVANPPSRTLRYKLSNLN